MEWRPYINSALRYEMIHSQGTFTPFFASGFLYVFTFMQRFKKKKKKRARKHILTKGMTQLSHLSIQSTSIHFWVFLIIF